MTLQCHLGHLLNLRVHSNTKDASNFKHFVNSQLTRWKRFRSKKRKRKQLLQIAQGKKRNYKQATFAMEMCPNCRVTASLTV